MRHPIRFAVFAVLLAALGIAGIYAIGASPDEDSADQSTSKYAAADTIAAPATPTDPPAETVPASMDNRPVQLTESEAKAVSQFETQIKEYSALRQKLETNLEPLGQEAKPEEIDKHREALRGQIKTARVGAKRGDFFTPGMEALVKRVCATTTAGSEGEEVQSTIMDENPGKLPSISVNDRYPDSVPVTTMPTQVLEALPKLSDYLEYRFLGKRLVLVDAGAGVVLDYTPDVLP